MMKRCLSLLLAVALIAVLVVPVSAAESNVGGWIELLEQTSVQSNGENWFEVKGQSSTVTIPLHTETRLVKIEALIWHQTADYPSAASVTKGGTTFNLNILRIENNLSRVYGEIPTAYYEDISIKFSKPTSGNAIWQMMSCKVSPIRKADYNADAILWIDGDSNRVMNLPGSFTSTGNEGWGTYEMQVPILVRDWAKYDEVTVFGSLSYAGLNSVRASVGTTGVPYEMTYTSTNATGYEETSYAWADMQYYEYDDAYKGEIADNSVGSIEYGGKVLYTITVDLSGIDRTMSSNPLVIYYTMVANEHYGYAFNVQGVTGSVNTADTTQVTWWHRFTSFMTDLFGADGDSGGLDDLGSSSDSISQNTSQIHDFEQSQQAVLDNNFTQIQGAISFTNFATALVFVQKYTNMTFNGISQYAIVFTLPLFLGLFFYLCSRIPGITRWKTPPPRSPSPKSKGGGKT